MKRLSIKLRVTLWFTLLMVLLSVFSLALLLYGSAQSGLAARRELLTSLAEDSEREIEPEDGTLKIDRDLEPFRDGVYLSVYDAAGVPLYGMVPRSFDNSAPFADREVRTLSSGDTDWFVYDVKFEIAGYGDCWVRGICEAEAVDSTIGRVVQLALIIFPFFVLLSAAGGYLLTRGALRPVRQIAHTARQISEGNDLSRRIGLGEGRDEIYTLAAEFDRMFARLERAFENEKQFTADASHELRTPVSVILSQCDYGLSHPGEERQALAAVETQAGRMAALISQLLTLSRAESRRQQLTPERVELSGLAAAVAEQIAEQAREKEITVETDIEPDLTLMGDQTMLMRLLINLMENAVHYGRKGGWIQLSLHRSGEVIEGCVADDGPGIPAEQQPLVWNRFWQADPSKSGEGAGLGLAMVRWIAEAHGGTVRLESAPGEGARFYFTLAANHT